MVIRLILQSNENTAKDDEELGSISNGRWRKEVILLPDSSGVVIATSQNKFIDLAFGREIYDHRTMHMTADEMDRMCRWWTNMLIRDVGDGGGQ